PDDWKRLSDPGGAGPLLPLPVPSLSSRRNSVDRLLPSTEANGPPDHPRGAGQHGCPVPGCGCTGRAQPEYFALSALTWLNAPRLRQRRERSFLRGYCRDFSSSSALRLNDDRKVCLNLPSLEHRGHIRRFLRHGSCLSSSLSSKQHPVRKATIIR